MNDQEETANPAEEFNFDEWTTKLKLSRKVTQTLRQEELVSKDVIQLLKERELQEMGLPLGARKVLMVEIQKWNNSEQNKMDTDGPSGDFVNKEVSENNAVLEGAGKTLDTLLCMPTDECMTNSKINTSANSSPFVDPRVILTMRATKKKTVHITQFLSEETKRRRQNRRQKEFILRSGKTDQDTVLIKADEEHPYLGIFVEEWGAANMRLLNHLLSTDQLKREDIEFYLAYTTKIFDFSKNYEWSSILNFDYNYRELQAEHGFRWGTLSPHMEMQTLVPKRSTNRPSQSSSQSQQQHTKEDCRIFKAKGTCPFGTKCRYNHPPLQSTTATPKN